MKGSYSAKNDTNKLQPFGNKVKPVADVLKIKLVLQNSIKKNSKATPAQVCAAIIPIQQQQPALPQLPTLIQLNDTFSTVSSNTSNDGTANLSQQRDVSEHVTPVEKWVQVIPPTATVENPAIVQKEEPLIEPPAEITQHRADRQTAMVWAAAEDVRMQHQKQTSSQLLHFLKAKGKNTSAAPEFAITRQSKKRMTTLSPTAVKQAGFPFEPATMDHPKEAQPPQMLSTHMDNQIPVFNVKRVEPGGTLIYSYVTATKKELWDIGDILMDADQGDCDTSPSENKVTGSSEAEDPCEGKGQQGETLEIDGHPAPRQGHTTNRLHIPEFKFPKFEETEVVVSHIVDPGNFYVQQADSAMKLQALVTE